jgi:ribosome maturation factor RimP
MRKDELTLELENLFKEYLASLGFDLVELNSHYEGRRLVLRLLVDKPEGGIILEECAGINRKLGFLLDEKNLIQDSYILEVSSPGLDRPLKTKSDFRRNLNRRVKFYLLEAVNGKIELEGLIKEAGEAAVEIDTDAGTAQIPFTVINKAKQII